MRASSEESSAYDRARDYPRWGPAGAGKTAFVEAILGSVDRLILAARCVRDDALRQSRESAAKSHPELRRYRAAGAAGAAAFSFPSGDIGSEEFFMTDLMGDYSEAVVLEGDSPVAFVDLSVFVTGPLPAGKTLFVRRKRDRAREERATADAMEKMLRQPDGVAQFLEHMVGGPFVEMTRQRPQVFEDARTTLLAGIAMPRKAPPPEPTRHWAITDACSGIEGAQMVVVNVRNEEERKRGERLVADVVRLRKDEALFNDILGFRGTKIPITAVVVNLADPGDPGRKKALARVKRALPTVGLR